MKRLLHLLARDACRAVFDMPGVALLGALAGWGCVTLFHAIAYGIAIITWPLAAVCGALAFAILRNALSENVRTRTFLPLLVAATTLGGLAPRLPLALGMVIGATALVLHAIRRRAVSVPTALVVASSFLSRWAVDAELHTRRDNPSEDPVLLVLSSSVFLAVLLVGWPRFDTRGNRRLFGVASLAVVAHVAYELRTTPFYEGLHLPVTWTALATMVVASVATLWSAVEDRDVPGPRSAYR